MNEPVAALPVPVPRPSVGPATRLARSMMELVVGAPHVAAAERVAAAGASIAEFVGAPVRKVLEPAFDARSDAAQDAFVSFLDLTRIMVQEAIELVDINAVLEKVDIDALLRRIDVNDLMSRVDVADLLERIDVDDILKRVDINALMARVDVTELIGRVDIEAMLDRVDMNEIIQKVDIDGLVERTEIGSLIVRSTSGVATEALDAARTGAVGIDTTVARIVDRVLRRAPGPVGPGLPAPDTTA